MRVIIQRVSRASVSVDGKIIGSIDQGILALLGISDTDSTKDADYLLNKIINLRIFEDSEDKMNLSLADISGQLLVVSQFTLYGDARRGRRPSFLRAATPSKAKGLYNYFVNHAKQNLLRVETGKFQAMMQVESINDGPVTIMLDSEKQF
ncbi:MAG: D-aminoacyl-tRNA deacylase [Pyrinomonadaceae bacterium]